MLWLSHVSVPMRMSGSCVEMKLPSSAVLFLILWKFILMILRGLWACLSAVVVGGEASLLLVGDVLMSSEENELLVLGEGGCLWVEECCMIYSARRCCGEIRSRLMTCSCRWYDARCRRCRRCRTQPYTVWM